MSAFPKSVVFFLFLFTSICHPFRSIRAECSQIFFQFLFDTGPERAMPVEITAANAEGTYAFPTRLTCVYVVTCITQIQIGVHRYVLATSDWKTHQFHERCRQAWRRPYLTKYNKTWIYRSFFGGTVGFFLKPQWFAIFIIYFWSALSFINHLSGRSHIVYTFSPIFLN